MGVVTDHGDFPVERIAVELGGQGRWVGSVGHDETLKLTDLRTVFDGGDGEESEGHEAESKITAEKKGFLGSSKEIQSEDHADLSKRRKRKHDKDMLGKRKDRKRDVNIERSFFAEL
jgi:WD repeat-containing protein 55